MVFTTRCPQCGKILWFAGNLAGKLTICPACGAVMRLTPPPQPTPEESAQQQSAQAASVENVAANQNLEPQAAAPASAQGDVLTLSDTPPAAPLGPDPTEQRSASPFDRIQDDTEKPPEVVEQTYLTHQAAAAVGEVHVDVPESDVVQWESQQAPPPEPPPPPMTPPVWDPQPISGMVYQEQPAAQQSDWNSAAMQSSRIDSLMRGATHRTPEEEEHRRRTIVWGVGATLVVAMIIGILWLLRGSTPTISWEEANRDEILTLKQNAENLAMKGQNQDAYNTYQELERLVAGHQINDPYLQEELARSWERKDTLYNLIMQGQRVASTTRPAEGPTTAPTQVATPPPTTTPDQAIDIAPAPTTQVDIPLPPPPVIQDQTPPPPKRVAATRPAVKPDVPATSGITDAQIGAAIGRGVDYLLSKFQGAELAGNYEHYEGLDTLAVYALMQAELATHDKRLDMHAPFMTDAIEAMKKFPMTSDYVTYARSLRATALALYDRPQDHHVIRDDVNWLLQSQEHGEFTYNAEYARGSNFAFWDNSNSQYGLLGVWSGAEVGIQVPLEFWRDVRAHWQKYQLKDGEWSYRADQGDPSRSMTLAGIASLFVAQDYLDASDYGEQVGRAPFQPALDKALNWLESGDHSVIALPAPSDFYTYYSLYGLERTGLASGFKFYGDHDWYRECAAEIMGAQNADGSWGKTSDPFDTVVDTCFSMLFLARGRHPILMNKLRYEGDWANRPRDAANLARFASAELERPLNWQVVPITRDWKDWTDSPILYIAGDVPPMIGDEEKRRIKQYIENGGMLLAQADGGHTEFTQFVDALGKELFPQYHWQDLPANHPLLTVSYHVTERPAIRAITNGSRILMLHFPTDVSKFWQLRQDRLHHPAFELGTNLALYAAGKSELKNRLESDLIAMPQDQPAASMTVARVKYEGNWDPEPGAWPRARRWFRQQTSLDVDVEPTAIDDLGSSKAPMAHLIGTGKITWNSAQMESVKKYVENGGILVIEPSGAPDEFLQSFHDDFLIRVFPSSRVDTVADSSPMVRASADGMSDVSTPQVRQFVRSYTDVTDWRPSIIKSGSGAIVILPLDMTSGLLGLDTWGIAGYQPDYSLELMKNLVLWCWDGANGI
jgi:hypothetical protein